MNQPEDTGSRTTSDWPKYEGIHPGLGVVRMSGDRLLASIAREVDQDRDHLRDIMAAIGARPDPVTSVVAGVGERL